MSSGGGQGQPTDPNACFYTVANGQYQLVCNMGPADSNAQNGAYDPYGGSYVGAGYGGYPNGGYGYYDNGYDDGYGDWYDDYGKRK